MIINTLSGIGGSFGSGAIILEHGDTLPDTGVESQLFVIPKTDVNTLYVSYDAPSSPQEGDIWVEFKSTTESKVWFTSEEEPYLTFGLMGATQYVDSTWVDVEGYYYKNSEWSSINGAISSFAYTGNYTESEYTSPEGDTYTLYTLTGTGLMTIKARKADLWICGGGNGGGTSTSNSGTGSKSYNGGAGAYCAEITEQKMDGSYLISIAAAGGASYIEDSESTRILETSLTKGRNGGTGGGGGNGGGGGTGDGITKYPFGDSSFFKCHCAGGGGGGGCDCGTLHTGGAGGTNGGNGAGSGGSYYSTSGGAGGNYGGGKGGTPSSGTSGSAAGGGNAGFYGGGGGGNGFYYYNFSTVQYNGGAGYQGVCYVRIPK